MCSQRLSSSRITRDAAEEAGSMSIPGSARSTVREGKVSRVDEYTERAEALEAAGLSEQAGLIEMRRLR